MSKQLTPSGSETLASPKTSEAKASLPNSFPPEWQLSSIECFVLNKDGSRRPVSVANRQKIQGAFPYYGATGKIDSLNDFTHEGEHVLIGEDGANLLSKSKDLAFIVNGQFWVNNHAHVVQCLADVPAKFVSNFINSLNLSPYITGSAQPKLTKTNLGKISVPVPPLAEQKEIATQLDNLLAQVDTLKNRLDAIPVLLKRFRQSVLAAAVSGKLTEDWRRENKLSQVLKEVELNQLLDSLKQGWSPKCNNYPANIGKWGVIKTSSIQSRFFLGQENKELPIELEPRPELIIKKGDVLITRAGPRVRCGVTCFVDREHPKLMICDKVYRIRTDLSKLLPNYLSLLFNSPQYLKKIEKLKTGSSDSGMNMTQKKLKAMRLIIPPLKEQTEIVTRVETLFAFADKIESRLKQARAQANNLTPSLLAKAFRGDLSADWRKQNPDLITGENSAKALLARIKAEQEKLKPKRKTRKKKT